MSFDKEQFRNLVRDTLNHIDEFIPFSEDAVELLMLTCAQESLLGKYIEQVNGPAIGIFQIEPATHQDLVLYIAREMKKLDYFIDNYVASPSDEVFDSLKINLVYQIILARVFYYRFSEPLPSKDDVRAMAEYYKKYYNTHLGKATVEEAVDRYYRYA